MKILHTECALALSLVALLQVASLSAQAPSPLSLSEAIQRAQENSPLRGVIRAKMEGANARLRGASALLSPAITLAQAFGKNTGGVDEGFVVSQTIELGDKRRQHLHIASADQKTMLAETQGIQTALQFEVQSAYYVALLADAEQALAQQSYTNAETFVKVAEAQFTAGDVAKSNVVRSRIELTRAKQELEKAQTERTNRYAALKSLIGLSSESPLMLTDSLKYSPLTLKFPSLQERLKDRFDLRSARYQRESKEAALHSTRAQSQPDLTLEFRRSVLDPTMGGNSLRVGITFPLFDFGRIRADSDSAKATLQEQIAINRETERLALLELETAYRSWQQAKRNVEAFSTGRLAQSKELQEMAQTGYQKGANSYLELLDAQQIYRTEQTDYLRALAAYLIAEATLQKTVGGNLPQ